MLLSKARNRDRMRKIRLHKAISPPQISKAVQPERVEVTEEWTSTEHKVTGEAFHIVRPHYYGQTPVVDADGNVIPEMI